MPQIPSVFSALQLQHGLLLTKFMKQHDSIKAKAYQKLDDFGPTWKRAQMMVICLFISYGAYEVYSDYMGPNTDRSLSHLGQNTSNAIHAFAPYFRYWLFFSVSITLLWVILRHKNWDLRFYYQFWLRKVLKTLSSWRWRKLSQRESDILKSFGNPKEEWREYPDKLPRYIRRRDLPRKTFWPKCVFAIVTIFGKGKVSQIMTKKSDGKKEWALIVDLKGESYGIYSNEGKTFLRYRFHKETNDAEHEKIAAKSDDFYKFTQPGSVEPSWIWERDDIPLRWASGGVLPIAYFEGKYWALLFFRDRAPIGFNVANGASEIAKNQPEGNENGDAEIEKEYRKLSRLIGREFSEEVILLNRNPLDATSTKRLTQYTFVLSTPSPEGEEPVAKYINPRHAKDHAHARNNQDNIAISWSNDDKQPLETKELEEIKTPFSITVQYDRPGGEEDESKMPHIIYSFNPVGGELGIEVLKLFAFKMDKNDHLIDGEFDNNLIRRPIVLIEMDYLKSLYEKNGKKSIGSVHNSKDQEDCKLLPSLPRDRCKVFDADIELRKQEREKLRLRLKQFFHQKDEAKVDETDIGDLLRVTNPDKLTQGQKFAFSGAKITKPEIYILSWLTMYEDLFNRLKEQGLNDSADSQHVRALCPVTWKALETIFAHKLDYRKFDKG